MKIELKESDDKTGFILDVFSGENLIKSKTYWYDDLEEDYRTYLNDMSNDDNCDITTIENWYDWLEEEKEVLKERILEEK
jgi:hypothetical protein